MSGIGIIFRREGRGVASCNLRKFPLQIALSRHKKPPFSAASPSPLLAGLVSDGSVSTDLAKLLFKREGSCSYSQLIECDISCDASRVRMICCRDVLPTLPRQWIAAISGRGWQRDRGCLSPITMPCNNCWLFLQTFFQKLRRAPGYLSLRGAVRTGLASHVRLRHMACRIALDDPVRGEGPEQC